MLGVRYSSRYRWVVVVLFELPCANGIWLLCPSKFLNFWISSHLIDLQKMIIHYRNVKVHKYGLDFIIFQKGKLLELVLETKVLLIVEHSTSPALARRVIISIFLYRLCSTKLLIILFPFSISFILNAEPAVTLPV